MVDVPRETILQGDDEFRETDGMEVSPVEGRMPSRPKGKVESSSERFSKWFRQICAVGPRNVSSHRCDEPGSSRCWNGDLEDSYEEKKC